MGKPNNLDNLNHVLRNSLVDIESSLRCIEFCCRNMREAVKEYQKTLGIEDLITTKKSLEEDNGIVK